MTLNPRTAKITYLKEHHDEYDSYLLGSSSTSFVPCRVTEPVFGLPSSTT